MSLEVSPLLADDTAGTQEAATHLHARAKRDNLFIKIPGTPAGVPAIEESIFAGVPINVTMLFSREQYLAAAEAYLRGIERRIAAGLDPRVASVASLFVSRWDVAVNDKVPVDAAQSSWHRHGQAHLPIVLLELLESPRWKKLAAAGAMPQRLLWASTGTKDPTAADTLYVEALAAPDTINTLPEKTLHAFAEHGRLSGKWRSTAATRNRFWREFARAGIDEVQLAAQLQHEGTQAFAKSWQDLLKCLAAKGGRQTNRNCSMTSMPAQPNPLAGKPAPASHAGRPVRS